MRGGLLRRGVSTGRSRHASGRTAPSGAAGRGILPTKREPFRAKAQASDTVAHVLLQRVEEAHCRCA